MRPVSVFADAPDREIDQLREELRGRWRQAARAVMVLLSLHGLSPAQIAALLECHPATVRRNRSPSEMLDTAAPRTSPWLPPG
jgi:Homeodomain-like domain